MKFLHGLVAADMKMRCGNKPGKQTIKLFLHAIKTKVQNETT
jgi:hypothetical protein